MVVATDDSRLARLEAQMEQVLTTLQDMRTETQAEIRALNARIDQVTIRMDQLNDQLNARIDQVNTRIDRLTLAALGIGGGVIVALISLVGVLAAGLTQSGG